MGRKIGGLFFNPKKRRIAAKPCMQEMISFLSCLSQNQMNDEKCLHSKELLKTCLDDEVGDDAICILLLYNRLRVNFFEECIVCFHREIVFLLIVWFFYFQKIEFSSLWILTSTVQTAKSKKKGGSMNYHLQRLNKKMK